MDIGRLTFLLTLVFVCWLVGWSVCHNFLKKGREITLPCSYRKLLFTLFITFYIKSILICPFGSRMTSNQGVGSGPDFQDRIRIQEKTGSGFQIKTPLS